MHVLLVSACQKRAIKRTNALLDSYALRVGERSWATPITAEALDELHRALRRTATRQTAVICFRNDGRHAMKPLWQVGSRGAFGPDGHFPAGSTRRRTAKTPLARWVRVACLLAQAAGLAHDWGKFSAWFQGKLRQPEPLRDDVRHEWLSVRLLQAMRVAPDWQAAWKRGDAGLWDVVLGSRNLSLTIRDNPAPYCAQEAIDFLVASHHRLFDDAMNTNGKGTSSNAPHIRPAVHHSHVLAAKNSRVEKRLFKPYSALPDNCFEAYSRLEGKLATLTADCTGPAHSLFWWAVLVYARAALIFADHTVSAARLCTVGPEAAAANTCQDATGARVLNQPLDWHLRTVAEVAAQTAWRMAGLTGGDDGAELEGLTALDAILAPADETSRFQWQNAAASALARQREDRPDLPCLVFNMAGTGSGKTRMNLRAACLLSRRAAPRCSVALNLRSLTLQTGQALRESFDLGPGQLATVIGDDTVQALFERSQSGKAADDDENGLEPAFTTDSEDWLLPSWLEPFFRTGRERAVMGAPLLVSTIDFLCAAGSPGAQGHHVKALLRLMSADLVLDEIDGYEPEALVAVLRLVQLAALFRRNVICSSATLSMPTAQAVHETYRSGVALLHALENTSEAQPRQEATFIRAIIDDVLPPEVDTPTCNDNGFETLYADRLQRLSAALRAAPCLRRAGLLAVEVSEPGFLQAVEQGVRRLHADNAVPFGQTADKRLSFGLVRVATIDSAVAVARHLAAVLPEARVACYHSGDWRISRFHKERRLDALLSRKNGDAHIAADAEIAPLLREHPDRPFIVVATPVEEIGRDHDFDWAVIEPSSAQSIVQTAGRVNRHRLVVCEQSCNILVLRYNKNYCINFQHKEPENPVFVRPGYESRTSKGRYGNHDLAELLPWPETQTLALNAALRFDPACKLAAADDMGIHERTAPYFGPAGVFTGDPVVAFRLTRTPYANTPLREHQSGKQLWRLRVDDTGYSYGRLALVQHGAFVKEQWVDPAPEMCVAGAMPNAWLALGPQDMAALCRDMGLTPDDGMVAELTTFDTDTTFEHNWGFGIRRVWTLRTRTEKE